MAAKPETYDTTTMLLHWSIASLVFAVGLTSPLLDHEHRPALSTFHNVGGTVAMLLSIGWLIWQARRPGIASFDQAGATERVAMRSAIVLLDALLVIAPASGLVLLFAHGGALGIGAYRVTFDIPMDLLGLQRLGLLHHVSSAILVVVAGGHALHSVWHHVIRRDRLLARILPWHEPKSPGK